MSFLNSELDWSQVGNISTGPGTTVSDAFNTSYGIPTKELLPEGTRLYKFSGFKSLARDSLDEHTPLTPWWSSVEQFKHGESLAQRRSMADLSGVSMREWGRLTSVIKENWSSMDWLLVITLRVPVYAWFGGFKGMPRIDNGAPSLRRIELENKGKGGNLPGGSTQFYIPNFKFGHISKHDFSPLK